MKTFFLRARCEKNRGTGHLMGVDSKVVKAAKQIIESQKYSYDAEGNRGEGFLDDDKMDCSEFVIQSYRKAGFVRFPILSSRMMASQLEPVSNESDVQAGDIIYWSTGHVGIVVDPVRGTFAGSQTSTGPKIANYKNGYWAVHGAKTFLRYNQ